MLSRIQCPNEQIVLLHVRTIGAQLIRRHHMAVQRSFRFARDLNARRRSKGQNIQQRRLARSRAAHDRHQFALQRYATHTLQQLLLFGCLLAAAALSECHKQTGRQRHLALAEHIDVAPCVGKVFRRQFAGLRALRKVEVGLFLGRLRVVGCVGR